MVVLKMQECLSTSGYYITGTYTNVSVDIMEFVTWWLIIRDYNGCPGKGHTKSFASTGQNSLSLL